MKKILFVGGGAVTLLIFLPASYAGEFGTLHSERYPISNCRKQQTEQEHWKRHQEQDRIRRDKQELESEAWMLENRIRNVRHSYCPDYSGLSSKANRLAHDADQLGEYGAAWQFRRAASSLREAEREQHNWYTRSSTFDSREDEKRKEAERNIWSGRGSINTFNSGSLLNVGSSFNNSTSIDSW